MPNLSPKRLHAPAGALILRNLQNHLLEPMSALTHIIGAILACLGLMLLILKAVNPIRPWHLVSFIIFGCGMICLYAASGLYHALKVSDKGSLILRHVDHAMIFVLIAATYTPFCLIPLRGPWGWSIFGIVWGLALGGIIFSIFYLDAPRLLTTILYIAMGWVAVVGIVPLARNLPMASLFWLCAGGVSYTAGAVIYALRRPDPWPAVFGFHEIFHCLVILGSLSHFWSIYGYL